MRVLRVQAYCTRAAVLLLCFASGLELPQLRAKRMVLRVIIKVKALLVFLTGGPDAGQFGVYAIQFLPQEGGRLFSPLLHDLRGCPVVIGGTDGYSRCLVLLECLFKQANVGV